MHILEDFEKNFNNTPHNIDAYFNHKNYILIHIDNGQVEYSNISNTEPEHINIFMNAFKKSISLYGQHIKGSLLFERGDVSKVSDHIVPIIRHSRINGANHYIAIPDPSFFSMGRGAINYDWEEIKKKIGENKEPIENTTYFAGNPTGRTRFNVRLELQKKLPNIIKLNEPYTDVFNFAKYGTLLNLPGNGEWSNRLHFILQMKRRIINVQTYFKTIRYNRTEYSFIQYYAKPNKHYINYDLQIKFPVCDVPIFDSSRVASGKLSAGKIEIPKINPNPEEHSKYIHEYNRINEKRDAKNKQAIENLAKFIENPPQIELTPIPDISLDFIYKFIAVSAEICTRITAKYKLVEYFPTKVSIPITITGTLLWNKLTTIKSLNEAKKLINESPIKFWMSKEPIKLFTKKNRTDLHIQKANKNEIFGVGAKVMNEHFLFRAGYSCPAKMFNTLLIKSVRDTVTIDIVSIFHYTNESSRTLVRPGETIYFNENECNVFAFCFSCPSYCLINYT